MELSIFNLNQSLLATTEGKQAWARGVFRAKERALNEALWLERVARPLQILVIFVSFVHIFFEISLIRPSWVAPLVLPGWVMYLSAAAFTILIDVTALYLVATSTVSTYAGTSFGLVTRWFFYALTAALNGTFVLSHMPGMVPVLYDAVPVLRGVSAIGLTVLIPVALASLERAHAVVAHTTLVLVAETVALETLLRTPPDPASSELSPSAGEDRQEPSLSLPVTSSLSPSVEPPRSPGPQSDGLLDAAPLRADPLPLCDLCGQPFASPADYATSHRATVRVRWGGKLVCGTCRAKRVEMGRGGE